MGASPSDGSCEDAADRESGRDDEIGGNSEQSCHAQIVGGRAERDPENGAVEEKGQKREHDERHHDRKHVANVNKNAPDNDVLAEQIGQGNDSRSRRYEQKRGVLKERTDRERCNQHRRE